MAGGKDDLARSARGEAWAADGGMRFFQGPDPELFLRSIAEERRLRREFYLQLGSGGPLVKALCRDPRGAADEAETEYGLPKGVRPLPGEKLAIADEPEGAGHALEVESLLERPDIGPGLVRSLEFHWVPKRLALNRAQAYEVGVTDGNLFSPNRYGDDGATLEDCQRLGVRVVRHPGGRDLGWAKLAPQDPADIAEADDLFDGQPVPLKDLIADAIRAGLDPGSSTGLRPNVRLLGQLLAKAETCGLKLIFTAFATGSERDLQPESGCAASPCVEHSIGTDRLDASGERFSLLPWDEESHVGATSPGGSCFPNLAPAWSGKRCDWHLRAMDPACAYKREYIHYICTAMAELLTQAATWADVALADVVDSVEFKNECSVKDVWVDSRGRTDPDATGRMWGRAYLHFAKAMRDTLPSGITLRMPGLFSYVRALGGDWEAKKEYVKGFIEGMVREADEYYDKVFGMDTLADLYAQFPDLLQCADIHWYHRKNADSLKHIGYLIFEVDELKQLVEDEMFLQLPKGSIPEDAFKNFPVTVSESGYAVDTSATTGDWKPTGVADEDFQAWEVWRRLCGALASKATLAGWHGIITTQGGDFGGMGLRYDDTRNTAPASAAEPRPSWFAFQRLGQLLGDSVVDGRMVLPSATSRDQLEDLLGRGYRDTDPWITVLELTLRVEAGYRYAYLVLRDPSAPSGSSIYWVSTSSTLYESKIVPFKSGSDFCGSARLPRPWSLWPTTEQRLPSPVAFKPGYQPRLFFTYERAAWAVLSYEEAGQWELGVRPVTPQQNKLHQQPEWMDDMLSPLPGDPRELIVEKKDLAP